MSRRSAGSDPTPGRRRTWNEARGVSIHRRPLDQHEVCVLLDGRPAVTLVAGQPVCAQHARLLEEIATTAKPARRRPVLRKPYGRVAA